MELFGLLINMVWIWVALAVIFLIVEACTWSLTTIWFAGGGIVAAIAAALGAPLLAQIVIFLAVSIVLIYSTKSWREKLKIGKEKTNVNAIIGQTGFVIEEITPAMFGQVKVGGVMWTAVSKEPNITIEAGTEVVVNAVEGVKLIVTPGYNAGLE